MSVRIISRPIVDTEDEFLYLKVIDSVKKEELTDITSEIEDLNEDVLTQESRPRQEIDIALEATDGESSYKGSLTTEQILDTRVRSVNALNVIKDDDVFVNFLYKLLALGTYDANEEFEMFAAKQKDGNYDLTVVKKKEDFGIKLFAMTLVRSDDLVIDLFQWFNSLSDQSVEQFKKLNYLYQLNKIQEAKIKKLIHDNEDVMKNYEIIKKNVQKFNLILNEKKAKILELTHDTDVLQNLNSDRKEIDKYDIVNKSSIDLSQLSDKEELAPEPKTKRRKKVKKESVPDEDELPDIKAEESPEPNIKSEEDAEMLPSEDEEEEVTEYSTDEDV